MLVQRAEDTEPKEVSIVGIVSMSAENWLEVQFLHPITLEQTKVKLEKPDKDKKWGRV